MLKYLSKIPKGNLFLKLQFFSYLVKIYNKLFGIYIANFIFNHFRVTQVF